MTAIKLPKTPRSAFNPRRPASALLLSQIEHLEQAVGREPKRVRRTEGQAARYIAELTAQLLAQGQRTRALAPLPAPTPSVAATDIPKQAATTTGTVGIKQEPTRKHAALNRATHPRATPRRRASKNRKKTPAKRPRNR